MKPLEDFTEAESLAFGWHYQCLPEFDSSIMMAFASSSLLEREMLTREFPFHNEAYYNYTENPGWWKELNKRLIEKGVVKT